jgi:hypothetical protein
MFERTDSRVSLNQLTDLLSALTALCATSAVGQVDRHLGGRAKGPTLALCSQKAEKLLLQFGLAVEGNDQLQRSKSTHAGRDRRRAGALSPTGRGIAFLQRIATIISAMPAGVAVQLQPCWDERRREIRVGSATVKKFHRPAPNQELLLQAFEESEWPATIDDPLPPHGEVKPACRLRETVKRLNRSVDGRVIMFGTSANGQHATWHWRS